MTKKELKEKVGTVIMLTGRECIIKSIDEKEEIIKIKWLDNNRHSSRNINTFLKSFEKLNHKKVKSDKKLIDTLTNNQIFNIIENFENHIKNLRYIKD